MCCISVRRRSRRTFSTHFEIFRRRVGIFSLFFLRCFLKFMLIFLQFSIGTIGCSYIIDTSTVLLHNFVFLLYCLFVLYNAHSISVCVIAVSKSHEVLLKVRRLSWFFSTTTPTTSTTSRRFFHDVGHYAVYRPTDIDKIYRPITTDITTRSRPVNAWGANAACANRKRDILPQVVEVLFSHWLQYYEEWC